MPGYVDAFKPLMRRAPELSSLVPWREIEDESLGIMSTRDDGWLCCLYVENPDFGSLSLDAQDVVTLRLNEVWKLLPPGGGVWHHVRRREAPALSVTKDAPPVPALLQEEHHAVLNAPGTSWVTDVYVSVYCRTPPASSVGRHFWSNHRSSAPPYDLDAFAADTEQVVGLLRSVCPTVERLVGDALTAYLHSCVSVHTHPLTVGEGLGIHTVTADSGFWPGTVPIIGDFLTKEYVRSLTLSRHFPDGTTPAIFRALNRLPMAFDVVTRWLPKARTEAKQVTDKSQVNWLSMRTSWRAYAYEMKTGRKPEGVKNTFVDKQGDDADAARDHIMSGDYQLGRLTMTLMVRGETQSVTPMPHELAAGNARLMKLAQVVRGAGCSVIDDPINQTEIFVGSWPGSAYANIDTLEMTSLNFATLALSDTPWQGITWNTHLNAPPLLYARTEDCMRVGVDTFVGDLGDFLMIGPKGSGKSTLLGFMNSCWLIDATHALYSFDLGRSNCCMILCHGGQYHDLGREVSLQVMADLDTDAGATWIYDWVKRRVYESGVPKDPDIDLFLWGALAGPDGLRAKRGVPRTLSAYLALAQLHANKFTALANAQKHDRAKQLALLCPKILGALRPFAQGGAYGHLTDAPTDRLRLGRVHGFELEALLKMKDAYSAVLEIIFFRLQSRRDGTPTRYMFDEAWHYLNTPTWLDILTVELPAWRRENISGGFSTQSISQLKGSPLTPLLLESAQTRFFLPNPQALDDQVREAYLGLRLGPEEIERNIVLAKPRGEVYWTMTNDRLGQPRRRLLDLRLGPLAQIVCGANREEDHDTMDSILARYPAEEFAIHWFASHGFSDASTTLLATREVPHA